MQTLCFSHHLVPLEKNLQFQPSVVHIDFEKAVMTNKPIIAWFNYKML
jgi:hypothetical protein